MNQQTFKSGDSARIRHSIHSPYSGRIGIIMAVDPADFTGPYLVMFSDGLQFRYKVQELEPPNGNRNSNVMESLYRVISETRQNLFR